MNELNLAITVSDGDDVFAEVSIGRDRQRQKIVHVMTAAVRGVLQATESASHDSDGDFTSPPTDGEATVVVVADRIYRVSVENDWQDLPDPKLSTRVTSTISAV
ncbi:hypothetical protein C449_07755 [Halococcus saccharolyticus DSM 5350]|uniref:Uncharacterized protein n=1 Tax=Halococcus saccharolyticus DSM 5350 TaxID=1227455 RepID=M0MJI0_9EURY|nr:hypothetical protein [Halococcus saccharolyticus]EMA45498.1 hypothetical protein C449_07755 [Halococcus saccharolyticus DSM 5350]